jgi:hypothetical protein
VIPPHNPGCFIGTSVHSHIGTLISTSTNQHISTSIFASPGGSHWCIGTFAHWYINQLRNAIFVRSTRGLTTTGYPNVIPPHNPGCFIGTSVHPHIGTLISTSTNQHISTSIFASPDGSHWHIGTFPHWYINQLRNAIFVRSTRGLTTTGYPNVIPPHNPGCFIGTSVHPHIGTLISTSTNQHISTSTHQPLNLLHLNRTILHEIIFSIRGYHDIVFDTNANIFFRNIDARFTG